MTPLASSYFEGFGNVFVFAALGGIFVFVNLFVLGKVLFRRPHKPDDGQKGETFECGEPTMGDSWIRFDIRFYTLMLIFLIFDIEIAILFPWANVYDKFIAQGHGFYAFCAMFFFLGILTLGLAYDWVRKDLEWTSTKPGRAVSDEVMEHGVVEAPQLDNPSLAVEEESVA
ncbi:MAG: NADH-quinone oxidoreductase subunit A [Planctomycetota bacterium]|jgi:NADH-quinone oxidoreductase subunit A